MCGRYMLTTPVDALRQLFLFTERPNLPPRYNIAPTQDVPIVRRTRDGAARELIMVRWGLVPYWADDPKIGNRLINARARERGAHAGVPRGLSAPALPGAGGRLLRMAEGRQDAGSRFWCGARTRRRSRSPGCGSAGRSPAAAVLRSCTIITCPPNELVAPVHDRMPVILAPERLRALARPGQADGRELLKPYPAAGWRPSR